jgi:hypothetical protein
MLGHGPAGSKVTPMSRDALWLLVLAFGLTACHGSSDGTKLAPPPDQAIGGVWEGTDSDGISVLNVAADGTVFEQDPASGCVLNGQVGIIDGQLNMYDLVITYSSCTGPDVGLNGVTFTGLVMLDNVNVYPETLIGEVTGTTGSATSAILLVLPRS